ncbi:MAG: helix-turn-helix domain-containing protein [Shimia sp.]|nr:helix-turn-helix domain-containing protein [Shimia sp.]MCP4818483.1 helix-turn-helix domain-containing protein [Shimia sp.]
MTSHSKKPRGRPKSQFREGSAGTLQSLDRALSVLVAVAKSGSTTLTDMAMSLGIPTATTHRILTTLQKHDFTAFDEDRQEWVIGIEAYRTGASFLDRTSLSEVGRPLMRRLMEETGETANLAIHDNSEVVFIGQVETSNPVRALFPSGTRTSMHASGTGKAILSALPEDEVRKLLLPSGLIQYTPKTHVNPTSLFADLATARDRGWSFDREERYVGMSCIGSAIFDQNEQPVAGVSISGPSIRFEDASIAEFGAAVAAAAAEITSLTGGRAPADYAGSKN